MKITDIESHLAAITHRTLISLGATPEQASDISLADSPDPALGDRGFPTFALARVLRKAPPLIATEIVASLREELQGDPIISEVIAAGPYVNFKLDPARVASIIIAQAIAETTEFGAGFIAEPEHWMIEYSAPNTNKPQHLGHVRNDLLGASVARILGFAGHKVTRVNLINDRGIHICKSMLMYKMHGQGETPASTGQKGDHLVGRFYVKFDKAFNDEYTTWQDTDEAREQFETWRSSPEGVAASAQTPDDQALAALYFKGYKDTYFNTQSTLGQLTRTMLIDWERGDEQVRALWDMMNQWVFEGFEVTYDRLGVGFDQVYRESQTYLLGKDIVAQGLKDGIFEQVEGGAIACDLDQIGMPGQHKILQRSNGTSVYMTQDLGTATARFDEHDVDRMIYVVGDEQLHHFRVLFGILGLLRPALQGKLTHLSYGMVELPEGRMKTREGTVVDADGLMDGTVEEALQGVKARYTDLSETEHMKRAEAIGLGALAFFILYFNPSTTVHFDPKKAIDFTGKTGTYVMYAYARIQSIATQLGGWPELDEAQLFAVCKALGTPQELAVVDRLRAWPHSLNVAARDLDPSKIAGYAYDLASDFSTLYNHPDHVIKHIDGERRDALLALIRAVGETLRAALTLLGIRVLDEM